MKRCSTALACAAAVALLQPVAFAKGGHAAGGHSGGHASGGHASGGHAGSAHAGGHASGGHATKGRAASRSGAGVAATRSSSVERSTPSSVPGARPRDNRPAIGTAVPRTDLVSPLFTAPTTLPFFFNTSLFARRPIGGLFSYPFFPVYGSASGYGYSDYLYDAGSPALLPYEFGPANPFDENGPTGGLRLVVEPRDAQVFVDGFYAGMVDDFDGRFQRLKLAAGAHHIEIRSDNRTPLAIEVLIAPGRTTVYRGTLPR